MIRKIIHGCLLFSMLFLSVSPLPANNSVPDTTGTAPQNKTAGQVALIDSTMIKLLKVCNYKVALRLKDGREYKEKVLVTANGLMIRIGRKKKREIIQFTWEEIESIQMEEEEDSFAVFVILGFFALIGGAAIAIPANY